MSFTFETVDVKDLLVKQLKADLLEHGYNGKLAVKVLKADPQTPAELPCVGVNRVDDSESSQSITDGESTVYDRTTGEHKTIYGTFFSESLELRVWHTNADERDKLYQMVKAALFAARSALVDKGLRNIELRGGRDEQDSTMSQAPMVLYWATITLTYLNPLDVQFVEIIQPIVGFDNQSVLDVTSTIKAIENESTYDI